jgi:hypothetical protein
MQAADDRRCELRLAGSDRPAPPEHLELLTARLRAFGICLCELAAQPDGLPLLEEIPTPPIPHFESPRKAA